MACLGQLPSSLDIEFIPVENGSKDDSRQVLQKECTGRDRFKIVYVDENRGYGYGLICGMQEAVEDYIGWLHADLQSRPEDMLVLIQYAETKGLNDRLF